MNSEQQTREQPRERRENGPRMSDIERTVDNVLKPSFEDWKKDLELRAMQHGPRFELYIVAAGVLFAFCWALLEMR